MPDDSPDVPGGTQDQAPEDVEVTCSGGFQLPAIGAGNAAPEAKELSAALAAQIKNYVRRRGGGDVQAAFGRL